MSPHTLSVFPGETPGFVSRCEPVPAELPQRAHWCITTADSIALVHTPSGDRLPQSLTDLGLSLTDLHTTVHAIGSLDGLPVFAAEISPGYGFSPTTVLLSLRALAERVSPAVWAACAVSQQILHWARTNSYCGQCGGRTTQPNPTERALHCPKCERAVWPRLSPCVIVRVTNSDGELLLVRQPSWPTGRYSLVAGFVEPGETLEQCVRRELREEANVTVTDITYLGSQPWPFPHQLMVGFSAQWESGEPRPNDPEIEDVRWFAPESVPETPPSRISIAQRMIEGYLLQRNK